MQQHNSTASLKFRGYFAESLGNGQWRLRGRGQRRDIPHSELLSIVNARPKKKQPQQKTR